MSPFDCQIRVKNLPGHYSVAKRKYRRLRDLRRKCPSWALAVVLVRQRPGKGNAIFVTLEDEGGITNVLIWSRLFERHRREVMASRLMLVEGEVQRSEEGVVHLMACRIVDRSGELIGLMLDDVMNAGDQGNQSTMSLAGHPRAMHIVPPSRDFH